MRHTPAIPTEMRRCICGAQVRSDSFRDRDSYRDAYITGLCQECQDSAYFAVNQDEGRHLPIFDGALLAVRSPGAVHELCLLPFRFVASEPANARLVWEARRIARAGPWMDRIDLGYELEPMANLLAGHQVRASEHRNFDADALCERLAPLHLLVGLDRGSLDTAAAVCRIPEHVSWANFAEEVPWSATFGRTLRPLETWCGPEPGALSTVRMCAVMGMLLVERGRTGLRPLDYLLEPRSGLFGQPRDAKA